MQAFYSKDTYLPVNWSPFPLSFLKDEPNGNARELDVTTLPSCIFILLLPNQLPSIFPLATMGYDGLEFWEQNPANVDIDHLRMVLKDNDVGAAQLCPYFDFTSG